MEDGAKRRDLEDRTFRFAESVRTLRQTVAEKQSAMLRTFDS